jgi:hypothetical protein
VGVRGMDVFWNDPLAGIVFLLIQYLKRLSSPFCSCACFVIFLFQTIDNLIKIPICGPPIKLQLGTVAHYAFRIYHEREIELLKQKFSLKTTHFKIENAKKHFLQRYGQNLIEICTHFVHTFV